MLTSVLLMVLTQALPCLPGETSAVCNCKNGAMSACVALVGEDPGKAARVLDEVLGALEALQALEQAHQMTQKDKQRQAQLEAAAESLASSLGSSEPPHCKGQQHHLISRRIAERLAGHRTLKGLFKPRDSRFVTQAKDEESHCGYQQWHREVDQEVIQWLDAYPKATPEQFIARLREIYGRPEMQARFPNGF